MKQEVAWDMSLPTPAKDVHILFSLLYGTWM